MGGVRGRANRTEAASNRERWANLESADILGRGWWTGTASWSGDLETVLTSFQDMREASGGGVGIGMEVFKTRLSARRRYLVTDPSAMMCRSSSPCAKPADLLDQDGH